MYTLGIWRQPKQSHQRGLGSLECVCAPIQSTVATSTSPSLVPIHRSVAVSPPLARYDGLHPLTS